MLVVPLSQLLTCIAAVAHSNDPFGICIKRVKQRRLRSGLGGQIILQLTYKIVPSALLLEWPRQRRNRKHCGSYESH